MDTMKINNLKKYIILSFVLITILASFGLTGSVAFAADKKTSFDETYVLDDLNGMIINNKQFTVNDYPKKLSGDFELLNLVEFAYTYDKEYRGNYALYVYIYNPSGIQIVADSAQNKIQLGCKYDENNEPVDFEKYNIKLCSVSSDGLYLKYKVIDHLVDGKSLSEIVNRDARRYDVTGIELLSASTKKLKDYKIGRYFVYSGYSKGMAQESVEESTLKCSYDESETISLKLNHTNFKTCYSGYSFAGTQQSISSVYFAVDNYYLEKYGYLYSLMMTWNEAKCAPFLVIDDEKLYNLLSKYSGAVVDKPSGSQLSVYEDALKKAGYDDVPSFGVHMRFYFYLNASAVTVGNKQVLAPFVIYTGGTRANTVTISAREIENYMRAYNKSFQGGRVTVNGVEYSSDVFYTEILPKREEIIFDKTFNIVGDKLSFSSEAQRKVLSFVFKEINEENVYNISPIEELTSEKLNQAEADKNLFINKSDIDTVRSYVSAANADNKTVYVVRFDVSTEVIGEYPLDPGGYISYNTVYLGLDVIWLKFFNDVSYKVIGVVSDPIDVFTSVTPPPYSRWTGNKLKDAISSAKRKIVLAVFGVIVAAFSVLLFTGIYKGFISRINNIVLKASVSVVTLLLCVALSFAIVFFISVFIYGKVKNIEFDNAMYVFWRILWPRT